MTAIAAGVLTSLLAAAPSRAAVATVEIAAPRGTVGPFVVGPPASPAVASLALPPAAAGPAPSMAPAAAAVAAPRTVSDIPPAGPRTSFDAARISWMRARLVDRSETATLTPAGFNAIVLGRQAETAEIVSWLEGDPRDGVETLLRSMYDTLRFVMDSELPAEERGRTAYVLNRRFASFLDLVARKARLPEGARAAVSRANDEFLKESILLEELARHRQIMPKLEALERSVQAALQREGRTFPSRGSEDWRIGAPLPAADRGVGGRVDRSFRPVDEAAELEDLRFSLEQAEARRRLAEDERRFSPRLRLKTSKELATLRARALELIRYYQAHSVRVASYTLPRSFLRPNVMDARKRRIIHVPDNENLRMLVRGGEIRISVRFETDIQDDAVLGTIRDSIEDYWRGRFVYAGEEMRLTTRVAIRKLGPGEPFTPGSLTLRQATDAPANAGAFGVVFDRDLTYATAAHEFGHVLGLNDEYVEGYRASDRTRVQYQDEQSLMGSPKGTVLPRHLKAIYQLLRRRSRA